MLRQLNRQSQAEFQNHEWGDTKSTRIVGLFDKHIDVIIDLGKNTNNANVLDVCTNMKHLLVQMKYNLELKIKNEGEETVSKEQGKAISAEFQKIRKLIPNQFLNGLTQNYPKKSEFIIGSLNYHLKYQSKEIQTQLLQCQVETMTKRLNAYQLQWQSITSHNISLTKQNEQKKIQLLSMNKSLMNLLMEKAILQSQVQKIKQSKPSVIQKIVIDYSEIQRRVNEGYQNIIQKLVKYSAQNIFSAQNNYTSSGKSHKLKCITALNLMILPKTKQNMDSINQYYNNFQKGSLSLDQTVNLIKSLQAKQQKIYQLQRRVTQMQGSHRQSKLSFLKQRITRLQPQRVQQKQTQTDNKMYKKHISSPTQDNGEVILIDQNNESNIIVEEDQIMEKSRSVSDVDQCDKKTQQFSEQQIKRQSKQTKQMSLGDQIVEQKQSQIKQKTTSQQTKENNISKKSTKDIRKSRRVSNKKSSKSIHGTNTNGSSKKIILKKQNKLDKNNSIQKDKVQRSIGSQQNNLKYEDANEQVKQKLNISIQKQHEQTLVDKTKQTKKLKMQTNKTNDQILRNKQHRVDDYDKGYSQQYFLKNNSDSKSGNSLRQKEIRKLTQKKIRKVYQSQINNKFQQNSQLYQNQLSHDIIQKQGQLKINQQHNQTHVSNKNKQLKGSKSNQSQIVNNSRNTKNNSVNNQNNYRQFANGQVSLKKKRQLPLSQFQQQQILKTNNNYHNQLQQNSNQQIGSKKQKSNLNHGHKQFLIKQKSTSINNIRNANSPFDNTELNYNLQNTQIEQQEYQQRIIQSSFSPSSNLYDARKRFDSLPIMKNYSKTDSKQNNRNIFLPTIDKSHSHNHDKLIQVESIKLQEKIKRLQDEILKSGKGKSNINQQQLQKYMKLLYTLHKGCGSDCKYLQRAWQSSYSIPRNKKHLKIPKYDLVYDQE